MKYIYHLKPDSFEGTSLIPLNLMDKSSSLYQSHAKKYAGREHLMTEMIPKLNCKWNDVVQFSALDPHIILKKLKEFQPDLELFRAEYFKIPIDQIIPQHEAVVFNRPVNKTKGDYSIHDNDVEWLSLDSYQELTEVPVATVNYWNDVRANGGKFLWFPYVPHIFIKGIVDTRNFEVCKLII